MPFKDIRAISNDILGDTFSTTFPKKVILVMYYAELLAFGFNEIEDLLRKIGRDKIFQIFFLESNFAEHIYNCFLNSKVEDILPQVYHRLIKIQELSYCNKLLHSNQILSPAQ